MEIRVQFERNRDVRDPRALSALLEETAERVKSRSHPDPYIRMWSPIILKTSSADRQRFPLRSPVGPRRHKMVSYLESAAVIENIFG